MTEHYIITSEEKHTENRLIDVLNYFADKENLSQSEMNSMLNNIMGEAK